MALEARERPEWFTRPREDAEGAFLAEEDATRDNTDLVYDSIVQEALTGEKFQKLIPSLSKPKRTPKARAIQIFFSLFQTER